MKLSELYNIEEIIENMELVSFSPHSNSSGDLMSIEMKFVPKELIKEENRNGKGNL